MGYDGGSQKEQMDVMMVCRRRELTCSGHEGFEGNV